MARKKADQDPVPAEKNVGGRPTKYRPEYDEQARKLCLMGAIDAELADFFDVAIDTISEWKNVHPNFSASIKQGKMQADSNVADRLYNRAMGYEHPEVHISNYQGEITKTPITKVYPPDTAAAIFWLKNRQKGKWRDKVELAGDPESPLTVLLGSISNTAMPVVPDDD